MAVISKGTTFATGDQVTALKLNNLADAATFASGAVDSVSTQLSSGAIIVKDGGVTTAKIANNAVTTAKIADSNVTKAKIENVADMKVLGNVSGSAAAPTEVSVIDDDTMATASATALATSESIKAYVDDSSKDGFSPSTYTGGESVTFPNGLIMKWGISTLSGAVDTITFGTAFPNAVVNVIGNKVGADTSSNLGVTSFSTTVINVNPTSSGTYHWQAIGY